MTMLSTILWRLHISLIFPKLQGTFLIIHLGGCRQWAGRGWFFGWDVVLEVSFQYQGHDTWVYRFHENGATGEF